MISIKRRNRRVFWGCCLLLAIGAGLAAYLALKPAQPLTPSRFEAKLSNRAHGLLFRRLSLQDEKGRIDPDGLRKAKQHIEEMKKIQPGRQRNRQGLIEEAGVRPDSWTWLGPGNVGGRVRSIVVNPNAVNDMLAGSVSGGIWRTLNGGALWFPVDDFMANLAVSTIVRNPTNANNLYAGTGEGFGNIDGIQGAGIFRSDNGGITWNQLAPTNNAGFNFVNRLAISPNGATLLAATNSGVWRSTDGGETWNAITVTASQDIDFHPTDNTRAVVGEYGRARFSTDGGVNWTSANFNQSITGRVELAYAPNNPLVLYASVDNNSGDLYRSTDGGQNYTRVNTGTNYLGNQGWYDNIVWVNPQDANFVVVGGIQLWRSTNGGTTLTQISDGSVNSAHADHHFIVAHPGFNNSTNRIVYFGNDGGVYRADDVATVSNQSGWQELNNNLGITQFYGAAGNTSGIIIGGTQDNGTLRFSGDAEGWTQTFGADGGFCAADQTDSNILYGETQWLNVLRSTDAGQTAASISVGIGDQPLLQTNFIAPVVLDPTNPDALLAGGWSLWRSNNPRDATPTWTAIKSPTPANVPISAIAVSPGTSSFIVVGHNDGSYFQTFSGTIANPAWTQRGAGQLPVRFMTRLVIDNSRSPNWIYATFGGYSADNVYRSTDLGLTWTDITGSGATGLPNVPVRSLVYHPHNRNLLYVGTEVGIFTSNDAGATWDLPNGGPANVSVDELFWIGGDLIAATHGRGMYRASGGIYVDCNYTGVQRGTFHEPFRTVNAAINAVTRYTPIWLKPCNYNEQINTGKRLEIRSLGGAARIGTP